jgi:hypothetical protein
MQVLQMDPFCWDDVHVFFQEYLYRSNNSSTSVVKEDNPLSHQEVDVHLYFLYEEPQNTGVIIILIVASLAAFLSLSLSTSLHRERAP